jgi:hypothetical protein
LGSQVVNHYRLSAPYYSIGRPGKTYTHLLKSQ